MEVPALPEPLVAKRKREDGVALCCQRAFSGSPPAIRRGDATPALQTVCAHLSSRAIAGGIDGSALSFTGADGQAGDWRAVVTRVSRPVCLERHTWSSRWTVA